MSKFENFTIPAELSEFYQQHKQEVQVIRMLNLLARMTDDVILKDVVLEQPRNAIAIAITTVQDTNTALDKILASISDDDKVNFPDVYTKENLLLATVVSMTLMSMHAEAELVDNYTKLADAMFKATNIAADETVH
jgi:hypothetical protein